MGSVLNVLGAESGRIPVSVCEVASFQDSRLVGDHAGGRIQASGSTEQIGEAVTCPRVQGACPQADLPLGLQ